MHLRLFATGISSFPEQGAKGVYRLQHKALRFGLNFLQYLVFLTRSQREEFHLLAEPPKQESPTSEPLPGSRSKDGATEDTGK